MFRCVQAVAPLVLCVVLSVAVAGCIEDGAIRVKSFTLKGTKAVDGGRLKAALATHQGSWLPWGKKAFFDRSRFEADLERIKAFYADRGYPDARVTGFDVKLNDKQDAVDLVVTVAEGDPVKIAAVNVEGFDAIPPDELVGLKKRMPLALDQPRDRQLVVAAREMALNALRDHGFPYARVATDEDDGPDGKSATVTFTAEPGTSAVFGTLQVQGNKSVSDHVIEREVTFKPGDPYRRDLVQDAQRRLYRLEMFQFVNVEPLNQEAQPAEVPMRITVAEGKHQRFNFGVGYGTDEKARADAEYHHLNFLGGARSAGAHVRWSSLDRGARLDFTQPYLFHPHLSFSGEAQQWYAYTPAYRSMVSGAKATVTHRSSERTSWGVSITSEHDSSLIADSVRNDLTLRNDLIALGLNPETGEQSGTLNALGFDLHHSTADNALDAHRGYQITFHAETAGRFLPGTFNYTALSLEGRHYQPLGDRLVLASRAQLGDIAAPGGDQDLIPFSKRFFLGGATSVRGWGRYELSPLSGSGLPIGGNSMFMFSEEVRSNIRGKVGLVLFLDAGNVWRDAGGINLGDLRYAIGPGLRYQTPVGPIRFDFGYQLNPVPDLQVSGSPQTRRWRVHFSVGQAF